MRRSGIGEHIREVQKIFRPVFNATDVAGDGSEFDHLFKDGERFRLGSLEIEVLHVPGHTPADIAYKVGDAVFVGDTLFMPDYGTARADFPGGNAATLYRSIRRLLSLPPETRLFMCHDYKAPGRDHYAWETTVGEQRARNAHVKDGVDERYIRRHARGTRRKTPSAAAPAAVNPGQHPGGQAAARRGQRRALSQDPREARFLNRPDRTWRDPDALCRVGKAHDVVKVAVPQHEHAIEAIENLLIVGDGDDRRVLIHGQLAQEVHHDLRPL